MGYNTQIIELLSQHLRKEQSAVLVLSDTISLAQSHQVLPILYYQTKDEKLKVPYLQAISSYTARRAVLNQIKSAFSDIPFYIVKGFPVSQYYPIP